ncbi:MAG: succinylglutamate desuccinylase/aspartoacylase family protein [Pseudomonadota bacterium]
MRRFKFIRNPDHALAAAGVEGLLRGLGGPTCLFFEGSDPSRTRALVTLLHGNEPSGAIALTRWMQQNRRPQVNVLCVLASVHAALEEPVFTHRMLPRARDLNRCFRPPFDDEQGHLAEEILAILELHKPECVIDMHNTSGTSPAFAIATETPPLKCRLTQLFANQLLLMDISMGSLLEHDSPAMPVVTVEVGGRAQEAAHACALAGLEHYFHVDQFEDLPAPQNPLDVMHHPLRLELLDGVTLVYDGAPRAGFDVTLLEDLEQHNFGTVAAGTLLGWGSADPRSLFRARDATGQCALSALVEAGSGELRAAQDLQLMMITNNAAIAESDCLFYAVASNGDRIDAVDRIHG